MDVLNRTIYVPIWYDDKAIYVGTGDIPMGRWTVVLSLTPKIDAWLGSGLEALDLRIVQAVFSAPINQVVEDSQSLVGGLNLYPPELDKDQKRLVLKFDNRISPEGPPILARYTIEIEGYPERGVRRFDPVMVGQPDPIYPR